MRMWLQGKKWRRRKATHTWFLLESSHTHTHTTVQDIQGYIFIILVKDYKCFGGKAIFVIVTRVSECRCCNIWHCYIRHHGQLEHKYLSAVWLQKQILSRGCKCDVWNYSCYESEIWSKTLFSSALLHLKISISPWQHLHCKHTKPDFSAPRPKSSKERFIFCLSSTACSLTNSSSSSSSSHSAT